MFYHYLMTVADNDILDGSSMFVTMIVTIAIVVNLVLWIYYKNQAKTDQGFCLHTISSVTVADINGIYGEFRL